MYLIHQEKWPLQMTNVAQRAFLTDKAKKSKNMNR